MGERVQVLYDFVAQPQNSSELSVQAGEIITVTRKDVGEGWWEGTNSCGQTGLFPASFVEPLPQVDIRKAPEPSRPLSTNVNQMHGGATEPVASNQLAYGNIQQHSEEPDWPGEDWDDDDEDSGDNTTEYGSVANQRPYYASDVSPAAINHQNQYDQQQLAAATNAMSIPGSKSRAKGFTRFSPFVKSGLESYILEDKQINVPLNSKVTIVQDTINGSVMWQRVTDQHYTCAVSKHGKETKMKGLKSYISYEVTPSTSNIVVRRRYKQFDWLMQRMAEKFIATPLPPLPEKQIAGRFHEDFVEHRRNLLQLLVNYITRHPILSYCDVWRHFMTCNTDDMKAWKLGKRKAEKDELIGANFFRAVQLAPSVAPLDDVKTAKQLDQFARFVSKLDDSVKHMYVSAVEQSKKVSTSYSKDYKKLSDSVREFAAAFQSGTTWRNCVGLNEALRQTGIAYDEISRLHEEEPKYDFEPMADVLHQYRGLLAGWPEILQLQKDALNKRNDQERLFDEGKINETQLNQVNQRTNVTTYAILAEINHFHDERIADFKQMMQVFLTAQMNFHNDILHKLQGALDLFNSA